jgi:hypothetical protein
MKELINEHKGVKEPMHTIIEEEEEYEDSNSPLGSDNEAGLGDDANVSSHDISKDGGGALGQSFNSLSSSKVNLNAPLPVYSEPLFKDGSVYFNWMRNDIAKVIPLKNATKPEAYLDRIVFMGRKMINSWFGKEVSLEHFNMFIDLLKDKNYLLSFPVMLESFRKFNYFQVHENGYKTFCELILLCLTQSSILKSVTIPLILLNMSSTYYTTQQSGTMVYLMEGIRKHNIFTSDSKFWEACILYKVINTKLAQDDANTISSFQTAVVRHILSIAYFMNDIYPEKDRIRELCQRFLQAYRVSEGKSSDLLQYLHDLGKKK